MKRSSISSSPGCERIHLRSSQTGFGTAAAPFYSLYAIRHFHIPDSWGGTFQVLQSIGILTLLPVWAWVSERFGPAASVRAVCLLCVLTPLWAILSGGLTPWIFSFTFLLLGGSLGWGTWIAYNHYLLSHVSDDERPIFLALFNLLFAPSALYPYFGGMLVDRHLFGATTITLFWITAVITGFGWMLTLRLPQPDKG